MLRKCPASIGTFCQETLKCLIILEREFTSDQKLSQFFDNFGTEKFEASDSAVGTVKGNACVALQKFPESMVSTSEGQKDNIRISIEDNFYKP